MAQGSGHRAQSKKNIEAVSEMGRFFNSGVCRNGSERGAQRRSNLLKIIGSALPTHAMASLGTSREGIF